ncbi:hypothetical protein HED22_14260 [Thalassospira sp. HF15]|uniref:hypothetical protein n=1 Tax=Thalassospira sp. HF15 TaxID=2722755 RepID=UPI001431377A|nr:hypothetical protein [Thalassospira sp. HF15]NIY76813.1 hypothetical protein [Thalassospira sp. HF15]
MACYSKHRFAKTCAFATICFVALLLSFRLLPSASADPNCLRIALPEIDISQQKLDLYQQVMRNAGLCVYPQAMPQIRALSALRSGRIDGVFAAREDLPRLVNMPMVPGDVLLGTLAGYLIVREGPVESVADLSDQILGVPLGATWCTKLVDDYDNVVKVPRGTKMLQQMLAEGRIDAMLADAYSLGLSGGVPAGYKAVTVAEFEVHSWLKAEFADLKPQFDQGTSDYLSALQN